MLPAGIHSKRAACALFRLVTPRPARSRGVVTITGNHCCAPCGLTQRGAAPLDFPTSPVAGMWGKNFPHIPADRVLGTPPASRVRLRRNPHPVPALPLRAAACGPALDTASGLTIGAKVAGDSPTGCRKPPCHQNLSMVTDESAGADLSVTTHSPTKSGDGKADLALPYRHQGAHMKSDWSDFFWNVGILLIAMVLLHFGDSELAESGATIETRNVASLSIMVVALFALIGRWKQRRKQAFRAAERFFSVYSVCKSKERGVFKRIDENRELLEFLHRESPDLMKRCPWVEGWLEGQDRFLVELVNAVGIENSMAKTSSNFPRQWPENRNRGV
jgi:hypothetical protein